ncbi:hypothetical protein [Nocardia noduli]|uniref:hypothetical protein n=1 Tax=Nocardia noduli TaxID=2815722 RepID=UPI0020B2366D|nr:hypothetical protein [Nocardia noduli]
MSYPGGNPPQGQPQPGQWPGAPGQQAGQPYDAPQPYGQSAPQHQQAQQYGQSAPHQQVPQPYGQSAPHQQAPQQPYGQSAPHQQVPQPYGQSAPHQQVPQPYGQSAPHQQAPQPYGQSAPHQQVPQPYGQSAQHQRAPYGQPQQFVQQPAPQFGGRPGQFGQQQGQQQGPPAPPGITVNTSYAWTGFLYGLLVKPKIKINGQQVPNTRWGDNHIPVGPGTYHVWIATPWLFDMGPGEMPVQVGSGPGARVYYKPPAVFFFKGAIGFGPQKTPGILLAWLPLTIVAVLTVLLFVLALAASV